MTAVARHEFLLICSIGCIMGTLVGAFLSPPTLFISAPLLAVFAFLCTALATVGNGRRAAASLLLCGLIIAWVRAGSFIPTGATAHTPFFDISAHISRSLRLGLSVPHSALIDGILTGHDDDLPYNVKQQFNATGTRHITAVSGMNITILGAVFVALLVSLGLKRTYASATTLVAIAWYVLMIGSPASAVRAGIMGSLLVLKQLLGRPGNTLRLLIYATAAMLLWNPTLLTQDIGFQLSVLATAGIILLQPICAMYLKRIPEFLALRSTISTTLAAYFFTLPIISHYFGTISLSAIPANVFIAPAVTWVFVLGAGGVALVIVFPSIAYIALSPAHAVSTYITTIVSLLSYAPHASLTWQVPSLWWSVPYYALILLFVLKHSRTEGYFRVESES